tara:strand:+ start:372 stop:962 length:591 start_codon:yes stop_codon:yes gene_type:complete
MEHTKAIDYVLRKLQNELPDNLRYHSMEHTLAVLHSAEYLAGKEGLTEDEVVLLLTAAAYHDSGFTVAYKSHEEIGCKIAAEALPQFGYSEEQIKVIQSLIMATKIPQSPSNKVEKVLCDADLDYLGGDNYGEISDSLRDELGLNGIVLSAEEWLNIQIKFLENHHYWTDFALKVLKPRKQLVLDRLKREAAAGGA